MKLKRSVNYNLNHIAYVHQDFERINKSLHNSKVEIFWAIHHSQSKTLAKSVYITSTHTDLSRTADTNCKINQIRNSRPLVL